MTRKRRPMSILTLMLAVLPCSSFGQTPPVDEGQELPPGHPPMATTDQDSVVPPVPPDSGTGAAALVWDVPAGWRTEEPASSMRRAQYRVPGPAGDGECVVYYFGPGQGGDAMANASRWAGQFTQPDGRPSNEVMTTELIEVAGVAVLLVEVTGTYGGGMTIGQPRQPLPEAMLLGAIAQGSDANWFFKLTGPEATLRQHQDAFHDMIRSLRRGQPDA